MTSLEFIEKEIESTKSMLNKWIEALEENPYAIVLGKSIEEYVEEDTKHLNHLQQIKSELEVWEICKKKKVDIHDVIYCSNYEAYNYCLYTEYHLTQQEYETVKKAVGAKDE